MKKASLVLLGLALCSRALAWTPLSQSRRSFLTTSSAAATLLVWTQQQQPALAITLSAATALRNVKSCQKKLARLEDYVDMKDYVMLKQSLREAPFSDLRVSCTSLVRDSSGSSYADSLGDQYKTLMANLETMDSTASLLLRGRQMEENELKKTYQSTVSSLNDFVALVEEATSTSSSSDAVESV